MQYMLFCKVHLHVYIAFGSGPFVADARPDSVGLWSSLGLGRVGSPPSTSMSSKWTDYFMYIYVDTYVVLEAHV